MKTLAKKVFESLPYPRVVIVGGGFAGLSLVRRLANKPFKVTLVDKNNFHTFQPLLYQVATASLTPDSIAYPFRKMIGPMDNVIFRMAKVESVDWEAKELVTSVGRLPYDILVLATGSTTNFFGNRDMAAKAMQLKTVGQALDIRSDFLQNFERAVALSDTNQTDEQRKVLHFVIVFVIGPAGTGKSFLAIAHGLALLRERKVERLLLVRPAVEAGESLGFLPGDLQEKIDPYIRPLYDALTDLVGAVKTKRLIESGVVEALPLAYMRGRTLNSAYVVLDEAQNTTMMQMKMFLTRLGNGSQAVITGDITQIDLERPESSGLIAASKLLAHIEGIRFITLDQNDVVRHHLVRRIIEAFEQVEASARQQQEDPA